MISFVKGTTAGNPNVEVTTLAITIPATGAGNDLFIGVVTGNEAGHGDPAVLVASLTVSGADFGSAPIGAITNDKMRVEVWLARNVPGGITSVTVNLVSLTSLELVSYEASGVKAIGQVVTGSSSGGSSDTISLTTQYANNVLVAFFGKEAAVTNTYTSAPSGIFRQSGLNGAIHTDCVAGTVDNSSATATSLTCAVADDGLTAPIERAVVAIELWSVPNLLAAQGVM